MSLCDAHALAPDAAPPPPTHKTSQQVAVVPPGCQASAPRSFTRYPGHFARASRFSERAPIPANHHHQHGNPAAVAGRDSPPLQFHILLSSPPSHSALLVCQLFFYYVLLSRSPWLSFWELWRLCARWMQGVTCAPERACLFLLPRRQRALVCWLVNSGHINARLWNVTCHSWDTETPTPLHLPQHHTELSRRKYATKQQHTLIKDAVVVLFIPLKYCLVSADVAGSKHTNKKKSLKNCNAMMSLLVYRRARSGDCN